MFKSAFMGLPGAWISPYFW